MVAPVALPAVEDESLLAALPQLPQGRAWLRDATRSGGVGLADLVSSPALAALREQGSERLVAALAEPERARPIDPPRGPDATLHAGLTFLWTMLVACASQDEALVRRWAHAEAVRATELLATQPTATLEFVARSFLSDVRREQPAQRTAPASSGGSGGGGGGLYGGTPGRSGAPLTALRGATDEHLWWVPLTDYVELAPGISGPWRLIDRRVVDGWVALSARGGYPSAGQLARLLRERWRADLTEHALERMARLPEGLLATLAEEAARASSTLASFRRHEVDLGEVEQGDWPPCMSVAIAELGRGVNVNHAGRVFVASMAATLGLPEEATVELFAGAPDFSAETTAYQVGHIYERAYTPAGCESMKTVARCPVQQGDDPLCDAEWLKHPLTYVRVKQKRRAQAPPPAASPPTTPETADLPATSDAPPAGPAPGAPPAGPTPGAPPAEPTSDPPSAGSGPGAPDGKPAN